MINIFVEKSYTKCGRESVPRPFSQKSKLVLSLDQLSKFYSFNSFTNCKSSKKELCA